MGGGFFKMKKQAKILQDKLAEAQETLKNLEEKGSAGNGLVEVTLSGEKELKKIKIDPKCVDPNDVEGLEDLIQAAYMEAFKKIDSNSMGLDNFMPF